MNISIKNPTPAEWQQLRDALEPEKASTDFVCNSRYLRDSARHKRTLEHIHRIARQHDIEYVDILEEFLLRQTGVEIASNWKEVLPYIVERKYRPGG